MKTWREPKARWRTKVEEGEAWRMSEIQWMRRRLLAAMENTEPMTGYALGMVVGEGGGDLPLESVVAKNQSRVANKISNKAGLSGSILLTQSRPSFGFTLHITNVLNPAAALYIIPYRAMLTFGEYFIPRETN